MTNEITAEQRLFEETNVDFVSRQGTVSTTRALKEDGRSFDRDWWMSAAELGWTSLLVPEEHGGGSASGQGVMDLASVARLLGANVSPGPLNVVSTVIAGLVHPRAAPHSEVLESLMTGERVATWAVTGPRASWTPFVPGVRAEPHGDGWILNGRARAVEFGGEADLIAVVALTGDGRLLEVIVDRALKGITIVPTGSVDFVRTFADVEFESVRVSADTVVAEGSAAAAVIQRQTEVMNVLQVAESVGAMDRVFEFTLQWGFDRYSFGRPLVSYQALKHRYADDKTWLEASRAIARGAAQAVQDAHSDAPMTVSVAKSYVGDRGVQIIQDCVQLHGGLGVTMDHDLNVYLRRVMLARQTYGTPREHRAMIADLISEEAGL